MATLLTRQLIGVPLRVLILTGQSDELYHHWRNSTPFLRSVLENSGRFDVKVEEEVDGISARTLGKFDVLLVNYQGPRWAPETEKAAEEFVRSGKGMVAFHGVSYGEFFGQEWVDSHWVQSGKGNKGWVAYSEMLGMTWPPEDIGHAPRHIFTVKWVDRDHPIARGLPPTFIANDELYHRITLRPATRVLATAYDDPSLGGTGKDEPIVWTVSYGRGRAVYISLGHDLSAMSQPGFIAALIRGTEWTATGNVTLPAY
jgi:type 1 glutamine amidotransferase